MVLVPLRQATAAVAGSKAAALGILLRAGVTVPDGFVVPDDVDVRNERAARNELLERLRTLGDVALAVRSSTPGEDGAQFSGAGQYESVLGVRGVDAVLDAIDRCRRSVHAATARAYRESSGQSAIPPMAVTLCVRLG